MVNIRLRVVRISADLGAAVERLYQEKATWQELVKEIRRASGVGIFAAEKIALSHQGWRRLCVHWINHDPACRKQAARHLKHHGVSSLVVLVGERFTIIEPEAS